MAKVNVACPCGKLIKTVTVNDKGTARMSGTNTCTSCKSKVAWNIAGFEAFASIKK